MAKLVTLFGGGGFVGRYAAQALLREGARVRLVGRDPARAFFLKPQAELGQVQFVGADVTKPATVERAVAGSDVVVNLVGDFTGRLNTLGARNVAQAAAAAGVGTLVHVSAIGADPASAAIYGRSKAEGEAEARKAFPSAVIVRPSLVFGAEDNFVNRFAGMIRWLPVVPVLAGAARFQPVFAGDVGRAIARAALDPTTAGRTFELGGPEVLTMSTLNRLIARMIGRSPQFLDLPDAAGEAIGRLGFLPGAPMTMDQWTMLRAGNVASPGAEGLAALGIEATPIEAVAPAWLVKYRRLGRFGAQREIA